jgi:hypothetical protein
MAQVLTLTTYPEIPEYSKVLSTRQVSGATDHDKLVNAFAAVANDMALTDGPTRKRYTGVRLLPGEIRYIDTDLVLSRGMGHSFTGNWCRDSLSVGHNNYQMSSRLIRSASFDGDSLVKLVNWGGGQIAGINFEGYSSAEEEYAPVGLAITSTAGAGTFKLDIRNVCFQYCSVGLEAGAMGSAILDSDSWITNATAINSSVGFKFGHQQCLNWDCNGIQGGNVTKLIQVTQAAALRFRNVNTTDVGLILELSKGNSNGGAIIIEDARLEGSVTPTYLLECLGTTGGGYTKVIARNVHCGQLGGAATLTSPFAKFKAQIKGTLEQVDIGRAVSGANNRLLQITDNDDNGAPNIVDVVDCPLPASTLAGSLGTVLTDHIVRGRSNYYYNGSGWIAIADSTHTGVD